MSSSCCNCTVLERNGQNSSFSIVKANRSTRYVPLAAGPSELTSGDVGTDHIAPFVIFCSCLICVTFSAKSKFRRFFGGTSRKPVSMSLDTAEFGSWKDERGWCLCLYFKCVSLRLLSIRTTFLGPLPSLSENTFAHERRNNNYLGLGNKHNNYSKIHPTEKLSCSRIGEHNASPRHSTMPRHGCFAVFQLALSRTVQAKSAFHLLWASAAEPERLPYR